MSVFVCCLTFLFLFSLSLRFYSTSFLPKLFAATENNYAPSNAMLLTLVTRTGKTLFRINLLSEHLLYFIYLFLRGKKKEAAGIIQSVAFCFSTLNIFPAAKHQSVQSQKRLICGFKYLPWHHHHLHSSPFFIFHFHDVVHKVGSLLCRFIISGAVVAAG